MKFTFEGKTISGFRPLNLSKGLDDSRNAFLIIQVEDSFEIWESERFYKQPLERINETVRNFLNWAANSEYYEPSQVVRWFVFDEILRPKLLMRGDVKRNH